MAQPCPTARPFHPCQAQLTAHRRSALSNITEGRRKTWKTILARLERVKAKGNTSHTACQDGAMKVHRRAVTWSTASRNNFSFYETTERYVVVAIRKDALGSMFRCVHPRATWSTRDRLRRETALPL